FRAPARRAAYRRQGIGECQNAHVPRHLSLATMGFAAILAPGGASCSRASVWMTMTNHLAAVDACIQANAERYLDELKQLLRIPSISTLPAHRTDAEHAWQFLAARLREIGLENIQRILPEGNAGGLPLLYADWMHAAGAPTVLFYGHYDVQPPDPLNEWVSPPFEPTIRDGNIYARGSADDKGQLYTQ